MMRPTAAQVCAVRLPCRLEQRAGTLRYAVQLAQAAPDPGLTAHENHHGEL